MKDISVVIVSFKRRELLKKCLESISKSKFEGTFEIIVVVNGLHPEIAEFLKDHSQKIPRIKYFTIIQTSKSNARNGALKNAEGNILYFIDDDVEIEENNLQKLIDKFKQNPQISIIGGPNLTPEGSSFSQRCSGYVLSSVFGSAWVRFRYKVLPEDKLVDDKYLILCNLAFRREIFLRENIVFKDMACNEENEILYELKKRGYEMLYSPEIKVYHHRRENFLAHSAQFYRYGRGRAQMTKRCPLSMPWFIILPAFFILYLVSLLFLSSLLYLMPLFLYITLDIYFSLSIAINHKEAGAFFSLLFLFPLSHVAYGFGFLFGLLL